MKAVALASILCALAVSPATSQTWRGYDPAGQGHRTWSSHGGGWDHRGQADRPGDYRCDAYWDRGRDDCDAAWRDQRPFTRSYRSGHGYRAPHAPYGGYVYQPYNQGTQYWGAYGRPDQVYPGGGYGGRVGYAVHGTRDPGRSAWCAQTYRSYDPVSGYYRAYSGRLVFCG
jgi:hypothetical protein